MFDNNVSLGIKQKEKDREVPGCQTVILKTKDIEGMYEDIKTKEIQIYKPLTEEDWGTTFSILDLDGNKIEFVEK
jgi:predicted enzyme related to lactoylglutathione lyase